MKHVAPHQFQIQLHIFLLQGGIDLLHFVGNTTLRIIQALNEVVPNFSHQIGKAEKRVSFSMF